jgi:serine/threonine-protein kinase
MPQISNPDEFRKQSSSKPVITRNYSLLYKSICSFSCNEPLLCDVLKKTEKIKPELKSLPSRIQHTEISNTEFSKTPFSVNSSSSEMILGSGKVVQKIGEGGNSVVYKIWNSDLELFRAVKLCSIDSASPETIKRFETEAKIAAQLHHTNIIEVYAIGNRSGRLYMEMEFIDGISIDGYIRDHGAIPIDIASLIMWYLCEALNYAHTSDFTLNGKNYNGIIHRDLKPANVMLSRKGIVKLLDFGVARPCESGLCNTIEGDKIVGTLQYLSPEQMAGLELDIRSDCYSLGIIFYEMLTGKQLFPQKDITAIVNAKVENVYETIETAGGKTIPEKITGIVENCLNIKKEKRFASIKDLQNELEQCIDPSRFKNSREIFSDFCQTTT